MSAVSDGSVGQQCRTKFRTLKKWGDVFSSAGPSGLLKSIVCALRVRCPVGWNGAVSFDT
jgi:hypothetical protein